MMNWDPNSCPLRAPVSSAASRSPGVASRGLLRALQHKEHSILEQCHQIGVLILTLRVPPIRASLTAQEETLTSKYSPIAPSWSG
jgi:hypothetical protein